MTARWLACATCAMLAVASTARKPDERWRAEMEARQQQWAAEHAHLSKTPSHAVDDWTIHEDVDGSFYWFSRLLKRSEREPPKGWTRGKDGKWKADEEE